MSRADISPFFERSISHNNDVMRTINPRREREERFKIEEESKTHRFREDVHHLTSHLGPGDKDTGGLDTLRVWFTPLRDPKRPKVLYRRRGTLSLRYLSI